MIITELAVFERKNDVWQLIELMPDTTLETVKQHTEFDFEIIKELQVR